MRRDARRAGPAAAGLLLAAAALAPFPAPASADYEAAIAAIERGDVREGAAALRAAAHEGDARAQARLGTYYEDGGRIFKRDFDRAFFWYRKAAEGGHAEAQFHLGRMHRAGLGVERDEAMAAFWYRAAARRGHPAAQLFLGLMRESGRGVERDRAVAWVWYSLAAEQGDEDARFRRDRLAARMSGEDAARGRRELPRYRKEAAPAPASLQAQVSRAPSIQGDPLVFRIQAALVDLGYAPGSVDGDAGEETREAVRAFEREHGQSSRGGSRGELDERLLQRLREALETGKPAATLVRSIQEHLHRLGYPVGDVDGKPGPRTAGAVRAFQREAGVSADGRLSPDLLRLLRTKRS